MKDNTFTIAKGIGIILVVLGHCTCVGNYISVFRFIYLFHMPLFFFISGFFFKKCYIYDVKSFVYKRIKRLYLPFVMWNLLFIILHNFFYHINIYSNLYGFNGGVSKLYNYKDIIYNIIQVLEFRGGEVLLGPLWFLPVLFFSSFIALFGLYFFYKIREKNRKDYTLIIFFVSLSVFFMYKKIGIFYITSMSLNATAIYLSGYFIKQNNYYNKLLKYKYCLIVLTAILLTVCSIAHPISLMSMTTCFDIVYIYIIGLIGVFFVIFLSNIISNTKCSSLLSLLGNNTMIILILHLLCFKIVNLIKIYCYALNISTLSMSSFIPLNQNLIWILLYVLSGTGIPVILNISYKRLILKLK